MRRRLNPAPRWATAVLAVAVLVLVTLVALGARGLPGEETRPPPFPVEIDVLTVARVSLGILAGLAVLLLILLLLPGGPPVKLPARQKSSPFKLLAGIVLLLAVLIILQPLAGQMEQGPAQPGGGDAATQVDARRLQQSGSRWGLLILGAAVLLLVWGVVAATRPAAEPAQPAPAQVPTLLSEVIDSVLADLEESTDPREVVIGAYARMERILTLAGLPRHASDAPLEYLARSLPRLRVGRRAITRLTVLFEIARFSHHEIHPQMGREAISALSDIRNELSGAAS